MAFILELVEAPVAGTGMYWDLYTQCWDLLCPQHWDHQPSLTPWGLQSRYFTRPVPFYVRVGLFAEHSIPHGPCPPINPGAGILCPGLFGESHGCLLGSGTH